MATQPEHLLWNESYDDHNCKEPNKPNRKPGAALGIHNKQINKYKTKKLRGTHANNMSNNEVKVLASWCYLGAHSTRTVASTQLSMRKSNKRSAQKQHGTEQYNNSMVM